MDYTEAAKPLKRILAYALDMVVVYLYIIALYFSSVTLNEIWPFHQLMAESYLLRHAIAFFSLSLPLFLYFVLSESGRHQGTIGKRILRLKVVSSGNTRSSKVDLISRNAIKLLPWEWVHTFIHLNPQFFLTGEASTPSLIVGLIIPQVIVLIFLLTIFLTDKHRAPYERLSNTRVVQVPKVFDN